MKGRGRKGEETLDVTIVSQYSKEVHIHPVMGGPSVHTTLFTFLNHGSQKSYIIIDIIISISIMSLQNLSSFIGPFIVIH